jgi:hypothetical protein
MKVDHLEHLESLVLYGPEQAELAVHLLENMHIQKMSVKYDGSPSILYGKDENGEFFLATKSIFNKTPKRNYNIDDIHANHGTNAGLVAKLVSIFPTLKETVDVQWGPYVVQGDLMFDAGDLSHDGTHYRFCQNTIDYGIKTFYYTHIKLGIALHTVYTYVDGILTLCPNKQPENFRRNGEKIYYMMTPVSGQFVGSNPLYNHFTKSARGILSFAPLEYNYDIAVASSAINSIIRNGNKITYNNVKAVASNIPDDIIRLHQYVHDAKNVAIADLNRQFTGTYEICYINNMLTNHEGYVIALEDGSKIKLVNREVFSYENFRKWQQ